MMNKLKLTPIVAFKSDLGKATYLKLKTALAATQGIPSASLATTIDVDMGLAASETDRADSKVQADKALLANALDRALAVKKYADDLIPLTSGVSDPIVRGWIIPIGWPIYDRTWRQNP